MMVDTAIITARAAKTRQGKSISAKNQGHLDAIRKHADDISGRLDAIDSDGTNLDEGDVVDSDDDGIEEARQAAIRDLAKLDASDRARRMALVDIIELTAP